MRTFLSAHWNNLILANFPVDAHLLLPFIPAGTELDLWHGQAYVSLVAFGFDQTKVLSVPWPLHRNFEEINLRFYVKRIDGSDVKRGVVFIKEIVPRWLIATMANIFYNERYTSLPTRRKVESEKQTMGVAYEWKSKNQWAKVGVVVSTEQQNLLPGSFEEFIAEHYWGYTRVSGTKTIEYRVDHPPWTLQKVLEHCIVLHDEALYGSALHKIFENQPHSIFLATGSHVRVSFGRKLVTTQMPSI